MIAEHTATLLALLIVEAAAGYPAAALEVVGHPVMWIGRLIGICENRWNAGSARRRRVAGCALVLLLLITAAGVGLCIEIGAHSLLPAPLAYVVVVVMGTTGLAQRSLDDHVAAVLEPLQSGNLATARTAAGRIVGRDTVSLDQTGVSAAAIESLAESFCDGVVAPAFWFFVAGLPGLLFYKAINTADSMVGHRDARHAMFGWAAARTDDLLNLVPARLAGSMLCVAGGRGWRTMLRDAPKHASPNAGWPEAAMAGALASMLGGPVSYDGEATWRPTFGDGAPPDIGSLQRALTIYRRACILLWVLVGGLAWLL